MRYVQGFQTQYGKPAGGTLYQQAKDELNREIRIAADPHYDLPELELY
jgi:hypothetical protein